MQGAGSQSDTLFFISTNFFPDAGIASASVFLWNFLFGRKESTSTSAFFPPAVVPQDDFTGGTGLIQINDPLVG